MIFGSIFKGTKEEKEVEKEVVAMPTDSNFSMDKISSKKTKGEKKNSALLKSNVKTRANRVSHIYKSHRKRDDRSAKDMVNSYDLLIKPVITEKAAEFSEKNIYVFFVKNSATKFTVAEAIEAKYNVVPEKVRIAKSPSKPKSLRSRTRAPIPGYTKQKKKAYVYLSKNDKITLA